MQAKPPSQQVDSGLAVTQHQPSKTSLGWINGKLWLVLWTSTRTSTEDGWRLQVMLSGSGGPKDHVPLAEGVDVSSHQCYWIANWTTAMTTHGTESLLQDQKGYGTGKYPFVSSFSMTYHHPPWCGILPLNQRWTLATSYPCFTEQE